MSKLPAPYQRKARAATVAAPTAPPSPPKAPLPTARPWPGGRGKLEVNGHKVFLRGPAQFLGPHIFGTAFAHEGDAMIYLNRESVEQLRANDPEGWLTVFHEAAHVVFGDIFLPDGTPDEVYAANEERAEGFAHFMLSLIGRALEVAHGKKTGLAALSGPSNARAI
ncbi:MAG TPA: hypothetical protein PK095_15575 [Myxococcota bacterium]|nr:hypothetical protein [Myxococcota bacterium]